MRARVMAAGVLLVLGVAAACGGDGGESLPDVSTSSTLRPPSSTTTEETTTTTSPPRTTVTGRVSSTTVAQVTSTSTTAAPTTTTQAPTTTAPATTEAPATTTTTAATTTTSEATTTTSEATTTTTEETTTTTAATTTTSVPAEDTENDTSGWLWLLIALVVAVALGLVGWLLAKRHASPTWPEQARQFATDVESAGRSVLLGPELTDDLWSTALTQSTEARARGAGVLEHAPDAGSRQAINDAVEALRHAEIQAAAVRAGTGEADGAEQELSAAVARVRAVVGPEPAPAP